MKELFIFLALALLITYAIEPKTKTKILLNAIFFPFLVFLVFLSAAYRSSNSFYWVGVVIIWTVLPALLSGFVIFSQLKRKFNNDNNVKFPLVLIIFVVLSLIGWIVQHIIKIRTGGFSLRDSIW
jgi:hypothetical protein